MKPGKLDLPTIWRGCDWPSVKLQWLNDDGDPLNLNGWFPRAFTRHFNLNAVITDAPNGITRVSMSRFQTSGLRVGVEDWDWVWLERGGGNSVTMPPMLKGKVNIRHPVTNPEAITVSRIGGGSNYVKMLPPGNGEFYNEFHQNPVGLYALYPDLVRAQLTDMRARGQNQIALILWNVNGIGWPNPQDRTVPYLFGHSIIPLIPNNQNGDPYQATLSANLQENLINVLGLLNELEFTELHMRYGGQGNMIHGGWGPIPDNDNISGATHIAPPSGTLEGTTLYASHHFTPVKTCSVLVATDVFTTFDAHGPIDHGLQAGDQVVFTTTGAFPAPLTVGTIYFVIANGLSPTHFKISATSGGSALNITSTGSGTLSVVDADNEPGGGSHWSVWYRFAGDGSNWAFQCSHPAHVMMEAFEGNLPRLNRIASSDGVHPMVVDTPLGVRIYLRISPNPNPPNTYYPNAFTLAWQNHSPIPPTLATPNPPAPPAPGFPPGWHEDRMQESIGFMLNAATMVEANKGDLRVIHSMLGEALNISLRWDPINKLWVNRLWSAYVERFGPVNTTGGSFLGGGPAARATLDHFRIANLPLPDNYAADIYENVYEAMKGIFHELVREGGGQSRKPFYLQETFYNDAHAASELRQVLDETGMNFAGIYQWTRVRELEVGEFPDVYPFAFGRYLQL